MVGRTVGIYQLTEPLGQGGMGVVYKGLDLMVERQVAIKALRPEIAGQPEILERFRGEAIALARLNHPHIATLYSFFREGDEYFMVMEFVNGRTLESILRESGPFPPPLATSIASQVLEAIDHAGAQGILHRDIKPANVMITSSSQVKVTDFGIARVLGNARLTREGCAYGTLEYLAPERIRGQEGDVRSDLYSLGVVLYEMLCHRLPFERSTEYDLMRAHLEEAPPPLAVSSIPPALEQAVARALAKRPEDRFASAAEFRSALAAIAAPPLAVSGLSPASGAIPVVQESATAALVSSPPPPSGKRWALYGAAALVLAAAAVAGLLFWNHAPRTAIAAPPSLPTQSSSAVPQPQSRPVPASDADANRQSTPPLSAEPSAPKPSEPSAGTAKSTPPGDSKALSRREAALKALNQSGSATAPTKKTTNNDRRSRALEALQN